MRFHRSLVAVMVLQILVFALRVSAGIIPVNDVAGLQQAIQDAQDGDTIELADGIYVAPAGPSPDQDGFRIINPGRSFTIRSASGDPSTVFFDGANVRSILRLENASLAQSGLIVFQALTFRNGVSESAGIAGAVTMLTAEARFDDCVFDNNRANVGGGAPTGGGALIVGAGSRVSFLRSTWTGNSSGILGGGLTISGDSSAEVDASLFSGNRTNLAGHAASATGGAIHVADSDLVVRNTRFEANEAGLAGGALYAIGTFDDPIGQATVIVTNCTFDTNAATRHPTVGASGPTGGGAINAEDLTTLRVERSRFFGNSATNGGSVNLYRVIAEIESSTFRGNMALPNVADNLKGQGGTISVEANDRNDPTTNGGAENRRTTQLTLSDSLLDQGSAGVGGCLFATGDGNRVDGLQVPMMGSIEQNRSVVTVTGVIFHDCLAEQSALSGTGIGGAIAIGLTDFSMQDSLVIASEAMGANSKGGGLAIFNRSVGAAEDSALAQNRAGQLGGGIFVEGVTVLFSDLLLLGNTIPFGNPAFLPNGAAIGSQPDDARGIPVAGSLRNSLLVSDGDGLLIFDSDRPNGPINDMRYENNQMFSQNPFNVTDAVYTDTLPNLCCKTVSELNGLVVTRAVGDTDKVSASAPNVALAAQAEVASLLGAPQEILEAGPAADPPGPVAAFLGYAWAGPAGTMGLLDGAAVDAAGIQELNTLEDVGLHTLDVGTHQALVTIALPEPGRTVLALISLSMMLVSAVRSSSGR